jgi:FkbM family methyltransferase
MENIIYNGIKLILDPVFMSRRMIDSIKKGSYERQESKNIGKIIEQNEVVLEIGGGIGFLSTLIARDQKVKKIIIYEANPILISKINETLEINLPEKEKNWEVRHAVLANGVTTDFIDFYTHKDFWASSLVPIPSKNLLRIEKVAISNFNSVLADLQPTLIVCDIEGGELSLFRNADLSGVKKIYIEIHPDIFGRHNINILFNYFYSRGFYYDSIASEGTVILFSQINSS